MDNSNPVSVKEKVILITGALGQIGQSTSRSFLAQGARLILADVNLSASTEFIRELEAMGVSRANYLIQQLDITDEQSCQQCVDSAVAQFGRIDVLINNAAIDAKFDKSGEGQVNNSRFEFYPLSGIFRVL